jgi:flavin reductase
MAVSRQIFRDAMARLGAAVNIITSDSPAGRSGCTASAVCSVTDDPPTLLLCLNRSSDNNTIFKRNGVVCVNTLASGHENLSGVFAGATGATMEGRFAAANWTTLATGAPVLTDATVAFDCRITQSVEVGTHTVFCCEVEAIALGDVHEGLIYFGRAYHRLIHRNDPAGKV